MSAITRIGTVVVPVADQDEALEFYVGWVEVAPPGAATTPASRRTRR